jgi:hypothetical protein
LTEEACHRSQKKKDLAVPDPPLSGAAKIPHHSYSAPTIFLMLRLVLNASVSLRGSQRVLDTVNDALACPLDCVPSWFSVRLWLLRVGHHKLTRAKTIADDWCWIIDHTIQLGKTKCLLVLGIRLGDLPKGRCLKYEDLEPIDLLPVETSTGATVWQQMENTSAKTGVPRAIVSDCGSDLKSGVAMFCARHDSCVPVYDIKHKTACLLKAELTKDEDWLAFTRQAAQAKNQLKQTALSHLEPPNQRSKSRYMNIEILLNWGTETLQILDTGSINEAEKQQMPKLEWLKAYRDKLRGWDELLQAATLAEQYVRQEGVTREGYQALSGQFHEKLPRLEYAPAIK